MADENPVQNLCEEVTCPICLEYFKDPVMIDCGHNFCQTCISQCLGQSEGEASCPQCREIVQPQKMKPNRPLASIVEITKKFSFPTGRGAKALGRVCEGHQEPLKLFCEDDQVLICVICDRSKEHREHKVIPKEEAFEKYKGEISKHLGVLNRKRGEIVLSKQKETENQKVLEQIETERQKTVAEFKQMHEFLAEQEHILLAQLKELEDNVKEASNKHLAKLCEEMKSVEGLIKEMEEKQKQPLNDFLQDIKSTLNSRFVGIPETSSAYPSKTMEQIKKFSDINVSLKAIVNEFKDTFTTNLQEADDSFTANLQKKDANRIERMQVPQLHILTDKDCHQQIIKAFQPKVLKMRLPEMDLSDIRAWSYVMGTENITSGCHSWEGDMINIKPFWAFGVVGEYAASPNSDEKNTRIFALGQDFRGEYHVFTSNRLDLKKSPSFWDMEIYPTWDLYGFQKLCVSVNYKNGSVMFFDVTNSCELFSFSKVIQMGETFRSCFIVGCKKIECQQSE